MNATPALDAMPGKTARFAGFLFLFSIALVVVANYGINFRLIVPGNATETARNILAHESLFRLNLACNLVYALSLLSTAAALYALLRPAGPTLARMAALFRIMTALMWGLTALNSMSALRLLVGAPYLPVFPTDQLQTLARIHLASSYDAYYVGLPFWALASLACSWLWFRSRLIPRALAFFGLAASAWGAFCAGAFLVIPHFDHMVGASWYDLPLVAFETALGVWLLAKGLRGAETEGA